MRILLVASVFPPIAGGSANLYANLCRELRDCAVVAPRRSYITGRAIPGWREADQRQPFPVLRLDLLRPLQNTGRVSSLRLLCNLLGPDLGLRARVWRRISATVREIRPDVVCLGELHALAWLACRLRAQRVPVLHFAHGEEITAPCSSRLLAREAAGALIEADAISAVSSFTRRQLIERGADAARIHLVPAGVDTVRFSPGPPCRALVERHRLGGKRVLLTLSRVEERKGHDAVITAMPEILKAAPDCVYLIAGEGTRTDRLKALARRTGVEHAVIFAGPAREEEVADYYRTCDVFLMPNRTLANGDTEGFGLVYLEAGACGKPVIGGKDGGVPDAVGHEANGLLVDGRSAAEVAAAAVRLLNDPGLARRLGQGGIESARAASWAKRARQFEAACEAARAHALGKTSRTA